MNKLLICFFVIFNISCNYSVDKSNNLPSQENLFKTWIGDTLKVLNIESNDTIAKQKIELREDSLLLDIVIEYNLTIFNQNSLYKETGLSFIIELLKEYEELPPLPFSLEVRKVFTYTPSLLDNYIYDKIFYIEKLDIICKDVRHSYNYSKGSLAGKIIYFNKHSPKEYGFIHNRNGSIIKKLLGSN